YYEAKMSDGKKDIFAMNADGSDPVNLTNVPGFDDLYPAPSPFGDRLAFVSFRNTWQQIYWMSDSGAGVINVSAYHNGENFNRPQEWDPAWAPDGFTMYLVLGVTGKIRVYRWDSRNPAADPYVVTMVDGDYWEGEPAVSPSGEYVAYTHFFSGGNKICIAYTDRSKRKSCTNALTDSVYNSDPDWSPDGQWIAYTSKRGGNAEVHIVMISGAGDINLTGNPANDLYPAWQPAAAKS
ncbi:MAG: hypothetical protein WBM17_16680, partial [Anaerolineales bacterium]